MTPEWIAVVISAVVAIMSGFQIWQNINIKLAMTKLELKMEKELSMIREWARETFVSKGDHLDMLTLWTNDKNKKTG